MTAYLTYHEILSASGLQEVGAEGGGREAGEGVLRQDYSNSLGLTHHESMSILPPLASRMRVRRGEDVRVVRAG